MYRERRLGNLETWFAEAPGDVNLRVPQIVNQCVAFLCVEDTRRSPSRMLYGGTAFFVGLREADFGWTYIVTAKHCVDRSARFGNLKLRLNLKNQTGARIFDLPSDWYFHENPASDVAVLQFTPDQEFDYGVIDVGLMATKEVISENFIGIGDELFISGLFIQRHGTTRNIPILRTGVIAAMPDEPMIDDGGNEFSAYLAEVRSISGLSGSPVFVYLPPIRLMDHRVLLTQKSPIPKYYQLFVSTGT